MEIFNRKISIYLTWVFLKLNISPNTITVLMIISGVIGFCFMIQHALYYLFLGYLFLFIYLLFDNIDGEMARYLKKSSLRGYYLDLIGSLFYYHLSRIIPPIHLYLFYNEVDFLIIAFLTYSFSFTEHATRKSYFQAINSLNNKEINYDSIYYKGYGLVGRLFRFILFLSKQINDPVMYNSISLFCIFYFIYFNNANVLILLSYLYVLFSFYMLINTLIKCYIDIPSKQHNKKY